MSKKAKIVSTKHTPFLFVGLDQVKRNDGQVYELGPVTAMCRCGKSNNMPYCDGSHERKGLNEIKDPDRKIPDQVRDYLGTEITVHFNLAVCSHNGACTRGLPEVFNVRKKPWIMADNAPVEKIIETIKKCPSGALSYSLDGVRYTDFNEEAQVIIQKHGPFQVKGGIEFEDDLGRKPETTAQYELCRCGLSKNKPFCDGNHVRVRIDAPKDEDEK